MEARRRRPRARGAPRTGSRSIASSLVRPSTTSRRISSGVSGGLDARRRRFPRAAADGGAAGSGGAAGGGDAASSGAATGGSGGAAGGAAGAGAGRRLGRRRCRRRGAALAGAAAAARASRRRARRGVPSPRPPRVRGRDYEPQHLVRRERGRRAAQPAPRAPQAAGRASAVPSRDSRGSRSPLSEACAPHEASGWWRLGGTQAQHTTRCAKQCPEAHLCANIFTVSRCESAQAAMRFVQGLLASAVRH